MCPNICVVQCENLVSSDVFRFELDGKLVSYFPVNFFQDGKIRTPDWEIFLHLPVPAAEGATPSPNRHKTLLSGPTS